MRNSLLVLPGSLFCSLILALSVAACGGSDGDSSDSAVAAQAADGAESTSSQSAMVAVTTSGATGSTETDVAESASTAAVSALVPSGCATKTTTGNVVVYAFTGCTGPYGLVGVNGSLTVTYGIAAGGAITASYTSSNLKVGKVALELTGSATEVTSGTSGSLTFSSSSTATGSRGHTVSINGAETIGWNTSTQCVSLTGSWTTEVDALTWTTSATNYSDCANSCPAAGGVLSYTGPVHSVSLTFSGSATASYAFGDGQTGTIALACGT